MADRLRRAAVAAVAVSLLAVAGCGGGSEAGSSGPVSGVSVKDGDNLHGVMLPKPYSLAHVDLRSTDGRSFDLATDADRKLTLVFFGYTHCPDVCQVVMANLASALTRLPEAQRARVGMVFVTTDPARDTATVLRSYLDRFDPTFEGLTGDLATIGRLGRTVGVAIEKGQKLASGGYDVTHGTQVVGLEKGGSAPYVWTEGTDPASFASDITTILEGKATTT